MTAICAYEVQGILERIAIKKQLAFLDDYYTLWQIFDYFFEKNFPRIGLAVVQQPLALCQSAAALELPN